MMDSLAGFQLDGDLPDNIFEDDEIEIAVVKPILNDIIKDIIKDNEDTGGNNHQSNYQTIFFHLGAWSSIMSMKCQLIMEPLLVEPCLHTHLEVRINIQRLL